MPVIKLRRMIDVGHAERMGDKKLCIKIFGRKNLKGNSN
jgi:hypothetical protein